MVTHFTVSDMDKDENTLSRRLSVKLGTAGDLKFQTPTKVGLKDVTELPLYEAHIGIKPETIRKILESESFDRSYGRKLKERCKGNFNILNLEYNGKEVPTDKMVTALSDTQYGHTDIIVTPSWFELISSKNSVNVDLYMKLTKSYLDAAMTRNHKPIFGTIPQCIPPGELDRVLKSYIDQDVTSFVVDSHGRTLMSGSWIRAFQRSIGQYNIESECLLYSINAYQGAVRKTDPSIEAKDFIGFTAGFDIIGGKHNTKFPPQADTNNDLKVARIFKRDTYLYEKSNCSLDEKRAIDNQSVRDQYSELAVVRDAISEGGINNLLNDKQISRETINIIKSFKDRTTVLDDFI